MPFEPVAKQPDHVALEHRALDRWERERTFPRLREQNAGAPRFTLAWLAMFALATLVVQTGVDPVLVTEYSVIFSVVALTIKHVPILLVANDPAYMQGHENGRAANVLAVFYLVVILVVAVSAIPLMLLTNMGQG